MRSLVLTLIFSTLSACATNEDARCSWQVRNAATNMLYATDADHGAKYSSDQSCRAEAELRSRQYCSTAGFSEVTVNVTYEWKGPEKLLGGSPLVAGPLTSFACK